MPKNAENVDEGEEALELQGSGGNERAKNSTRRQRQRRPRFNRVKIIALATVCCIVLILLCAWFIFTALSNGHEEWIETIPGLHHHPEPAASVGSLITFRSQDSSSYKPWSDVIEAFLKDYNPVAENVINCDYDNRPGSDEVCAVDISWFGHCSREFFGFERSSPCIFLRFKKHDWTPEFYNGTSSLPADMPEDLKAHIANVQEKDEIETLWVTCKGDTPVDNENIGPIQYFPYRGFPGYYFPHKSSEHYRSPMVAVFFERPAVGILINIVCRVWAPNIEYDPEKGSGFVYFELMID